LYFPERNERMEERGEEVDDDDDDDDDDAKCFCRRFLCKLGRTAGEVGVLTKRAQASFFPTRVMPSKFARADAIWLSSFCLSLSFDQEF